MADVDRDYESLISDYNNREYAPRPPVAAIPEKPSAWRRVPDVGVAALKSAVGLAETGIGLADIPTGGAVGRGLERAGVRPREAQEVLSSWYSPQQQAAQSTVSEAFKEGFLPGVSAALRHPSTIATTVGESAASMMGGAGVARGILKFVPKVAPWAAGAIGEGVVGAGSAAEQIRQQSETGYLTPRQALSAVGSGAGTSAFGAVGGKFAQKFGVGDVETALARGTIGKSDKGFVRRLVESGFSEGVIEELPQSVWEQLSQNYALDRPLTEGLAESAGMGMLAGAGMGATVGALTRKRDLTNPVAEQETPPPGALPGVTQPPVPPGAIAPRTLIEQEVLAPTSSDTIANAMKVKAGWDQMLADGSVTKKQHAAKMVEIREVLASQRDKLGPHVGALADALQTEEETAPPAPPTSPAVLPVSKEATGVHMELQRLAGIRKAKLEADIAFAQRQGDTAATEAAQKALDEDRIVALTRAKEAADPSFENPLSVEGARQIVRDTAIEQELKVPATGLGKYLSGIASVIHAAKTRSAQVAALRKLQMQKTTSADKATFADALINRIAPPPIETRQVGEVSDMLTGEPSTPKILAPIADLTTPINTDEEYASRNDELFKHYEDAVNRGEHSRAGEIVAQFTKETAKYFARLNASKTAELPMKFPRNKEAREAFNISLWEIRMREGRARKSAQPTQGDQNAVQEPSPTEVLPSEQVQAEEAGGERGRVEPEVQREEVAPEGEAEEVNLETAGAKITESATGVAELASELDAVQGELSMADLTKEERSELRKKEAAIKRKALALGTKLSETTGAKNPISAESLTSRLKALFRAAPLFDKIVTIYATQAEAMRDLVGAKFSDTEIALREKVNQLKAMSEDERDNLDIYDFGYRAYVLYEAEQMMPKKDGAFKSINESNSFVIYQETDALVNINGKVYLAVKQEDPDATEDGDEIVWEFSDPSSPGTDGFTTDFADKEAAIAQFKTHLAKLSEATKGRVQGFKTTDGKIGLIAENIEDGQELGVFLHEVGVHLGMEKLIGKANMAWLDTRVRAWAKKNDGSPESLAALAAITRSKSSTTDDNAEGRIAYMVEELVKNGMNPQAVGSSPSSVWFRRLWAAAKIGLRKLGFKRADFSGQNLVDLAYGAAHIELEGTWHGTAADFRKFHHAYMGSGEGTQDEGWGTYLTQHEEAGREYMSSDALRKGKQWKIGVEFVGRKNTDLTDIMIALQSGHSFDTTRDRLLAKEIKRRAVEPAAHNQRTDRDIALLRNAKSKDYKISYPEGSLMRVASNVREDEFLDWDKPLSKQSKKVRDAIESIDWDVRETAYDTFGDPDPTGRMIYSSIAATEESDKAASKYLDSIGIKGNKYIDGFLGGRIQNLVIFNDKNIVRAVTYPGGKKESPQFSEKETKRLDPVNYKSFQAMGRAEAFIKKQGLYKTVSKAKMEDGTYDVVRIKLEPKGETKFSEAAPRTTVVKDSPSKEAFENAERYVKDDYETLSVATLSDGQVSATRIPRGVKLSEVSTGAEPVLNKAIAAMSSRRASGSLTTKIAAMVPFTQDLVKWAKDYMKSASHYWDAVNNMMAEVKRWSVETQKVLQIFAMMDRSAQNKVQHFLFDGKMSGFWGFQPDWIMDAEWNALSKEDQMRASDAFRKSHIRAVPVSPGMEAKWNALLPEEQKSAEKVLRLMYDLRIEHVKAVEENVKTMRKYAGALKTESEQEAMLKDINDEMTKLNMWANYAGPYVPTMRFGKWFVMAKSKSYLDADSATQSKMESDGSKYQYWQFETEHEAMQKKAELADSFKDGTLDALPKLDTPLGRKEDFAALLRLETKVREQEGTASSENVAEMLSMLRNITRELSDEYSEVQSRRQFKAVTGAKWEEVMLGVKIRGDQLAFTIGRLKHNRKVATAMYDMRKEVDESSDRTTASHLWNELNARYEGGLGESSPDEGIKMILGGVSFWKLLTNPMYFAVQWLQNPQYGIPSMMRQGFGYKESWSAWLGNLQIVNEVWTQGKVFKGIVEDMSWAKDPKKIEFLEWLRIRNLLDMGMESDTGAFDGSHPAKRAAQRTLMLFRNAVQNTEIINRVSAALAVYDMGKKKGMTDNQIRDAAEAVITDAHGLYAGFASPRYLSTKGFMRIPMQFRRFQLIQAGFLYKHLYLEAKKLKNPAERAAALRVMAATLGHTLAVSGLKGSVLWLVVSGLITLAGSGDDEDDPRDADTKATEWLGENYSPEFAEFIMRGAPTTVGMNISARASVNPLTILPFDNQTIFEAVGSKKKLQENAYTLVGGAAGGVLSDIIDGFDQVRQGDYYKGTEMMAPSLARGLMRAGRFTTEGVTKRNGDVTMTPDELSLWELVQQGVGTAPAKVQKAYWVQEKLKGVQDDFAEQATQIKHDYIEAFEEKDAEAKVALRKKWVAMNVAMRRVGLKPTPLSSLFRAPLEKRKRERQIVEGVGTTKATRKFVKELT